MKATGITCCLLLFLLATTFVILPAQAPFDPSRRDPLDSLRCRMAVKKGLRFLAACQKEDGAWPASPSHDAVFDTAVAGLALLSEGSTTKKGRFKEALSKAVAYLTERIPEKGPIRTVKSTGGDYEHFETWYAAFMALFLSEVYRKDGGEALEAKLGRLVDRLAVLQRETGGWCHDLRNRMARSGDFEYAWYSEDLVIATAYALAALESCSRAVEMPAAVMDRAYRYLLKVHNKDGGFQYGRLHSWPKAVESEPGRTAAAVFALTWQGIGTFKGLPRAVEYLEKNFDAIPVSPGHAGNVFSLNYLSASLACRKWSPDLWRRFVDLYVPRILKRRRPGGSIVLGKSHHDREAYNTALALIILQLRLGHLSFGVAPTAVDAARRTRPSPHLTEAVERLSIPYLLDHQEADGSWIANPKYRKPDQVAMAVAPPMNIFKDDCMAVTALCARALLAYAPAGADRSRKAVDRGIAFVVKTLDAEARRYATATTSPIWQAYLLDLLLDLHASGDPVWAKRREEFAGLIRRVLECIRGGECKGGGWTYTYYDSSRGTPRSFVTALVVRSLVNVKARGIEVPEGLITRGGAWLDKARLEDGGYRYLYYREDWPPRVTPMGSVGRMALIEMARLRAGTGKSEVLERAVAGFFKHRSLLDRAVKAQTRYGNEGCHVYFAHCHLAEALELLPLAKRKEYAKRLRRILRERRRADGSWWDSDRAGPSAATALALLALRVLRDAK